MVTAIITAQSILMGFAFNVMVYISSQDALRVDTARYREDKAKFERLNTLADEIFYNLSYYIAVALLSVVLCVLWFIASGSDGAYVVSGFVAKATHLTWVENVPSLGYFAIKFLVLITATESILTFGRLIRRVTFHFKERRKAQRRT